MLVDQILRELDECHAAARDLARKGLLGVNGDPLPMFMSVAAVNRIDRNPRWFRELVWQYSAKGGKS